MNVSRRPHEYMTACYTVKVLVGPGDKIKIFLQGFLNCGNSGDDFPDLYRTFVEMLEMTEMTYLINLIHFRGHPHIT